MGESRMTAEQLFEQQCRTDGNTADNARLTEYAEFEDGMIVIQYERDVPPWRDMEGYTEKRFALWCPGSRGARTSGTVSMTNDYKGD